MCFGRERDPDAKACVSANQFARQSRTIVSPRHFGQGRCLISRLCGKKLRGIRNRMGCFAFSGRTTSLSNSS